MSKIEIQNILPDSKFTCFVIPSLFSASECEQILNPEIKTSFQKAISNYPTYYRNNERFVIDNRKLANQLFQKVKPYLPQVISTTSKIESENGIWHLEGLNNRLRYCKYSANQYFHRHLDGVHYRNHFEQSKLTFMIYLNGSADFTGGKTLFFKTKDSNEIWASYIPKQGDLIVFDHNVWHEGQVLSEGEKFVLRSDIIYSRKEKTLNTGPFVGHLGYIWSLLKFDKETILSGGRDKEIKVWSISGEHLHSLSGHQNSILCIEKINDNTFISGSRDQQIIVWKDFKILSTIHIHSALILSLCHLSENVFASSSGDSTVKISNLKGTVLRTFQEHTNWVWCVIRIERDILASCSEDCSIKIWNYKIEKSINTFNENHPIISIAFNTITRQLISGSLNGEVTIRKLDHNYSLQKIKTFTAHNGIIRTIKIIDDRHIATGGEDNKIRIWNMNGELIRELKHQNFVQSIEILDNKKLMSGSYDGTIRTWKMENYS